LFDVAVLHYLWSLKWSLAGFVIAGLLGFLSFGLLGYLLYYLAYPVVGVVYPPLPRWRSRCRLGPDRRCRHALGAELSGSGSDRQGPA
jgi:hypothetical protein